MALMEVPSLTHLPFCTQRPSAPETWTSGQLSAAREWPPPLRAWGGQPRGPGWGWWWGSGLGVVSGAGLRVVWGGRAGSHGGLGAEVVGLGGEQAPWAGEELGLIPTGAWLEVAVGPGTPPPALLARTQTPGLQWAASPHPASVPLSHSTPPQPSRLPSPSGRSPGSSPGPSPQ